MTGKMDIKTLTFALGEGRHVARLVSAEAQRIKDAPRRRDGDRSRPDAAGDVRAEMDPGSGGVH